MESGEISPGISDFVPVDRFVMGDAISQGIQVVKAGVDQLPPLRLQVGVGPPQTRGPQRGFIGSGVKKAPEAEHEFRDDSSRQFLSACTSSSPTGFLHVIPGGRVKFCAQVPDRITELLLTPLLKLVVAGISKHDLEIAEILKHRRADATVPLIQIQGRIKITANRRRVRDETFFGQQGPQALLHYDGPVRQLARFPYIGNLR